MREGWITWKAAEPERTLSNRKGDAGIRRPLLWYAGAYVLGEVLGQAGMGAVVAAVFLGAAAGYWGSRKNGQTRLLWLVLPFFVLTGGLFYAKGMEENPLCPSEWDGRQAKIRGQIRLMEHREDGIRMWLGPCAVQAEEEKEFPGLLLFLDSLPAGAAEGRTIRISADLKVPDRAKNPGCFDSRAYYRSMGISALAFGRGKASLEGGTDLFRAYAGKLRRWLAGGMERADRSAGREVAGMLRAMVLGEKWAAPEETADLYEDSGTGHLLSISGLHISMAGIGVFRLLRKRLKSSYPLAALACGAASLGCCILTGEGTGAKRSFLMLSVYGAGQAAGRTYDTASAAALAGLFSLIRNPLLLFQCGFQLSYGAVLALGLLQEPMKKKLGLLKLPGAVKKAAGALVPGIAVLSATLPIQAYFFFRIPVYGLFLNIVLIPLFLPLAALGMAGAFLGNLLPRAAGFCLAAAGLILDVYEKLSRVSLDLPGAVWRTGRPEFWQAGVYLGLLVLFYRLLSGGFRKAACAVFMGMVFCLMPAGNLTGAGNLELTFLDVGQGDCCLIRTPGGTEILIDGGSLDQQDVGKWVMGPFLDSKGIGTVDYALVSHGDGDHVNGIEQLLGQGRIGCLVLPGNPSGEGSGRLAALKKAAEDRNIPVVFMGKGDRMEAGEVSFECLWPPGSGEDITGDGNGSSMVLWMSYGKFDALFTGDLEEEGERKILAEAEKKFSGRTLDVLKVPHHGAGGSCTDPFLKAVAPCLGIISCGEDNRYGHPHPETLERLGRAGCRVLRTDLSGAVILKTDGDGMKLFTFLKEGGTAEGKP